MAAIRDARAAAHRSVASRQRPPSAFRRFARPPASPTAHRQRRAGPSLLPTGQSAASIVCASCCPLCGFCCNSLNRYVPRPLVCTTPPPLPVLVRALLVERSTGFIAGKVGGTDLTVEHRFCWTIDRPAPNTCSCLTHNIYLDPPTAACQLICCNECSSIKSRNSSAITPGTAASI